MRFLPLLSSLDDPAPWPLEAELRWDGGLHAAWRHPRRAVHAIHLPEGPLGTPMLDQAAEALRQGLGPDFLVIPTGKLEDRASGFALLGTLEALLEVSRGRVKLALRVDGGSRDRALTLLREARAEAVGFCWAGGDPEPLADRLWCAVGEAGADLHALQAQGYRWNLALPAEDPVAFQARLESLKAAHPEVLFPAVMPETALGRPIVPDDSVTFGPGWGQR